MEMQILYWLQTIHNEVLDKLMVMITTLGDKGVIWIVLACILLVFPKTRKCGFTMAIALIIMVLTGNVVLKHLIARGRPCWIDTNVPMLIEVPKDFSFPSGHTFSSFAAATTIFLFHKKFGIAPLVMASIIAFSRLYLFVHYPTDILGGIIFGVSTACIAKWFVEFIQNKRKYGVISRRREVSKEVSGVK